MSQPSTQRYDASWTNWADSAKVTLRRKLWTELRRPEQAPPDDLEQVWYVRGGRGSGKTRTGAETLGVWISDYTEGDGDWAVIAPTFADARDTCMEGESGLLRVLSGQYDPARWNRSMGQLHLDSGSTLFCDGADDGAERIQGKNLRGAWCDEIGLWKITKKDGARLGAGEDQLEVKAWDESLMFAVRKSPGLIVVTGTPKKGHILVRRLINDDTVPKTRMSMRDNIDNLMPAVVTRLEQRYANTALGRQELEGEYSDEVEGALWKLAMIDASRLDAEPDRLARVVVAIDPPGGATEAGIVTAGLVAGQCPCGVTINLPHAVVLSDMSLFPSGPNHWATVGINEYHNRKASKLIGEVNYGGDMVENTVRNLDHTVNTGIVRASRGKIPRAEPVAGLYGDPEREETWGRSRVHHVGRFTELEDEMTAFAQDQVGLWSPNRMDALVWAVTELGLSEWREARIGTSAASMRI